jgi:photosystem II stability/assembly factor-like uncharacterized protein
MKIIKLYIFIILSITYLCAETWSGNYATKNWIDISYDSTNNVLFAIAKDGTGGSKLYKSTDNGVRWNSVKTPSNSNSVKKIVSLSDRTIILDNGKLYYTKNSGQTLHYIGISGVSINDFSCNNNGKILADTSNGLMVSINYGGSWTKITNNKLNNEYIMSLHIDNANRLFVSVYDFKIYYSTNDGKSWNSTELNNCYAGEEPMSCSSPTSFTSSPNGNIYVGTYWDGVLKSTDHGQSWEKIANGLPEGRGVSKVLAVSNSQLYAIVEDQSGGFGLYLSNNAGYSWHSASNVGMDKLLAKFTTAMTGSGNKIWLTHSIFGTSYSPNNGAKWYFRGKIIPQNVVSIAAISKGELFVGCNDTPFNVGPNSSAMGILKSSNNGLSWKSLNYGFDDFDFAIQSIIRAYDDTIIALPYEPSTLLIKTPNNNIFKHIHFQNTSEEHMPLGTFAWATKANDGTLIITNYWDGARISRDNGNTWERLPGWEIGKSSKIAVKSNDGTYYVVQSGQTSNKGLFKLNKDGIWTYIGFANKNITSMLVTKKNHILVSVDNQLFLSRDKGVHWEPFSNTFNSNITSMIESCDGSLYVSTHRKVYKYSSNQWRDMSFPINKYVKNIYSLEIMKGYLYAGTNNGVFKTNIHSCLNYPIKKDLINYGAILIPILNNILLD